MERGSKSFPAFLKKGLKPRELENRWLIENSWGKELVIRETRFWNQNTFVFRKSSGFDKISERNLLYVLDVSDIRQTPLDLGPYAHNDAHQSLNSKINRSVLAT